MCAGEWISGPVCMYTALSLVTASGNDKVSVVAIAAEATSYPHTYSLTHFTGG